MIVTSWSNGSPNNKTGSGFGGQVTSLIRPLKDSIQPFFQGLSGSINSGLIRKLESQMRTRLVMYSDPLSE